MAITASSSSHHLPCFLPCDPVRPADAAEAAKWDASERMALGVIMSTALKLHDEMTLLHCEALIAPVRVVFDAVELIECDERGSRGDAVRKCRRHRGGTRWAAKGALDTNRQYSSEGIKLSTTVPYHPP